jgi:hypothetical protein
MKFCSARDAYDAALPSKLQILSSDARSPVYSSLCYLSSIMAGTSPRLRLVTYFRSCKSVHEWFLKFPADASVLFRACSIASASIDRRQRRVLHRMQIQALTMGDPDMPYAESHAIAEHIASACAWELSAGFEQQFVRRHRNLVAENGGDRVARIAESIWGDRGMLSQSSWGVVASVFVCESMHAYNRTGLGTHMIIRDSVYEDVATPLCSVVLWRSSKTVHVSCHAISVCVLYNYGLNTTDVHRMMGGLCLDVTLHCVAPWSSTESYVFLYSHVRTLLRKFASVGDQTRTLASVAVASVSQQLKAQHRSECAALCDVVQNTATQSHGSDLVATPVNKIAGYTRALSQTEIHRHKFVKDQLIQNPSFNFSTVEAWAVWRAAWAMASPEEKERCAADAESTKFIAAGNRALALAQSRAPLENVCGVGALVPLHQNRHGLSLAMADAACVLSVFDDSPEALRVWRPQSLSKPFDPKLFSALTLARRSNLPAALQTAIGNARLKFDANLTDASQSFRTFAQQMPTKDAQSLPPGKKFSTPSPTPFDPMGATTRMLDMLSQLKHSFLQISKQGGPPRSVGDRDVFIAVQLLHRIDGESEFESRTCFYHLADGKDQHANNPAVQSFIVYEVLYRDLPLLDKLGLQSTDSYSGIVIAPDRENMVEPWAERHEHPFGVLEHAPMVTLDGDRLASQNSRS